MSPRCKLVSQKNTILMTSLPYCCILGLAEIKTYAQKIQDAQVSKSLGPIFLNTCMDPGPT